MKRRRTNDMYEKVIKETAKVILSAREFQASFNEKFEEVKKLKEKEGIK